MIIWYYMMYTVSLYILYLLVYIYYIYIVLNRSLYFGIMAIIVQLCAITMYIVWMDSCTCSKVLWMGSFGILATCDPLPCYVTLVTHKFLSQAELQPSDATQDGIPVGEILGQTW